MRTLFLAGLVMAIVNGSLAAAGPADSLPLQLRTRVETSKDSGRYHTIVRAEEWNPKQTALIICDVWDLHHCLNAVRRVEEFAPRLEKVIQDVRRKGMTIIHAPSECMDAYKTHPARLRALAVPRATDLPRDIGTWCYKIPAEERGKYPIDQSDGGEDDDLAEHAAWAARLSAMGRNPRAPWKKETELLTIDPGDYISDKGDEIWSILQARGVNHVLLAGVHANMCVLGRPFGLRQMAQNGKKVVLIRDMTDTMYNPGRWPYVSHFTGTDLIVEHIEKFVCPTITSDQLVGGQPFRFKKDTRPSVAMLIGEDEYHTEKTLPAFAGNFLGRDFRVSTVFASDKDPTDFPGIEAVNQADVLLVSVRRRALPPKQMALIRRFVAEGKPVVGIRTASHAFTLAKGRAPAGLEEWPDFDHQVLGGNYHGHHDPKDQSYVQIAAPARGHPLLLGIRPEEFASASTLYKTSPLVAGTTVLLLGRAGDRQPHEPVAWTYARSDGGRSFYTSLGGPKDFELPDFQRLLLNGISWAAGLPIPKQVTHSAN